MKSKTLGKTRNSGTTRAGDRNGLDNPTQGGKNYRQVKTKKMASVSGTLVEQLEHFLY